MPEIDILSRLSRLTQNAAGRLRVRSALNPFLWMGAVFSVICFGAAGMLRSFPVLVYALTVAGIVPIFVTCAVGVYFAIRQPDRLHSEDYQIRAQALRLIEEKGGRIKVDPASVEKIVTLHSTPQPPQPGTSRGGEAEP